MFVGLSATTEDEYEESILDSIPVRQIPYVLLLLSSFSQTSPAFLPSFLRMEIFHRVWQVE